jgi:hypothetical protein
MPKQESAPISEVLRVCILAWRRGEVLGARFVTAKALRAGLADGREAYVA